MNPTKPRQIVTMRARKIVGDFLKMASNPENLLEEISGILNQMKDYVYEVMPALVEALGHQDSRARLMAAWFIIIANTERPSLMNDGQAVAAATDIVTRALRDGTMEDRLWACVLMSFGVLPDGAVPLLRVLVKDADSRIQTCAAAALAVCHEADFWVFQVLERALLGDDEIMAAFAAKGYARSGVRSKEAVATLVSVLGKVGKEIQYEILIALREIGPPARNAVPILSQMVMNQGVHPTLRGLAATALGSITKGTQSSIPTLMKAMAEDDDRIVDGVSRALVEIGHIPDEAVERLAALLSSPDADMRKIAAYSLATMGERASLAVPALMSRVGQESDARMVCAMAEALAAAGPTAVEPLLEIVKSGDAIRLPVAAIAFKEMGTRGVTALIKAIETTTEPLALGILVLVLRDVGPKAAPAVPLLARLLNETDDDEMAGYLVSAIVVTGSEARAATSALIRVLVIGGDELAWWATRALWNIGPEAIPELEAALEAADDEARDRIYRALAVLRQSGDKRFKQLEKVEDDGLLETFAQVGRVLSGHDELLTWPAISKHLKSDIQSGRIDKPQFPVSATDLRRKILLLSKRLKMPLTTHKPNKRGGGELTPEARRLLPLIQEYLQAKELRVRGEP